MDEAVGKKSFERFIFWLCESLHEVVGFGRHFFPEAARERDVTYLRALEHALADARLPRSVTSYQRVNSKAEGANVVKLRARVDQLTYLVHLDCVLFLLVECPQVFCLFVLDVFL